MLEQICQPESGLIIIPGMHGGASAFFLYLCLLNLRNVNINNLHDVRTDAK